jgi:threonine aldolase
MPATRTISFASDNYAGVHPDVLAAVAAANGGHEVAYGDDSYSLGLNALFSDFLGRPADVYPVFNGTGANVVSLMAMCTRWGGVVCTDVAHVNTDEGGAPERVGGLKMLAAPAIDGKLTPETVASVAIRIGDEHRAQPEVVSLTQSTEIGTVYSPAELSALAAQARSLGMKVHMDGSRIANAAASLGVPIAELVADVDVLSFGATKNGGLLGDAVVVLNPDAATGVKFLRKSTMQLASKMRFVSAQFQALLTDDLWLRNASHANAMAQRLAEGVRHLPGVTLVAQPAANAVFAQLPAAAADAVREQFRFYNWDESDPARPVVRWMCAWDTTEADVDSFVTALGTALA